jgi:hypothetical protein
VKLARSSNPYKIILITPTVLMAGVAWTIASATPPRFAPSAVLALEVRKVQIVEHEVVSRLPQESPALRTELDVMSSRSLEEQVVDRLGLTADPDVLREAGAAHSLWQDAASIITPALGRFFLSIAGSARRVRMTMHRLYRVRNSRTGWSVI